MTLVTKLLLADVVVCSLGAWFLARLLKSVLFPGGQITRLRGPRNLSFLGKFEFAIDDVDDPASLVEKWANEYGRAFRIPASLGASSRTVLVDPLAVSHVHANLETTYAQNLIGKDFISRFGRGILFVDGEAHHKQRSVLSPAFNSVAIRRLISVFYDSSYKLKDRWDDKLRLIDETIIDAHEWMNNVALDSIGIAGFGHDFRALAGEVPIFYESLPTAKVRDIKSILVSLLSPIMPLVLRLKTKKNTRWSELHAGLVKLADDLLERTRQSRGDGTIEERSVLGVLLKAEDPESEIMTQDEIVSQNVLMLAGYQTISISLTWMLIELARQPDIQRRLRKELSQFSTGDPTWEQLVSHLPLLDAVVHETLRMYPVVTHTTRVAVADDIIPLSTPIVTATGETVSTIVVGKGSLVSVPIRAIHRSKSIWGPDAKQFRPDRWLEDTNDAAKQFQGYRHLLTFSHGPRKCLGLGFAVAEIKVVLSVLIRNYMFELPDGPDTKFETYRSILPGPKAVGSNEPHIPMRVRKVDHSKLEL